VASIAIALLVGVGRGITTHIWWSEGVLLRQGRIGTLLLWVAGIGLRVLIGIVAQRAGVATSVTTGEIPLFFGVTLAAQNVVIWLRGQATPMPRAASAGERV
jgi:hypothetical protein